MSQPLPELLHGPYVAPEVQAGDNLFDVARGWVVVHGVTGAPIPWPYRRQTGGARLVLTGDLVRAVRNESAVAVVAWWGASPSTVRRWRGMLGVAP